MASLKIFVVLAVGFSSIHAQAPASNVDPAAKTVATGGTDFVVTSGQPAAPSQGTTGQQAGSLLDMALQSFSSNTPNAAAPDSGSQPPATGSNSLNTASSFMDAVNNLLSSPTGNMDPKILANLGLPSGSAPSGSQMNSIPNQVGSSGPSNILDPNMPPLGGNNGIPNGALVNMPLSSSPGSGIMDPLAANQGPLPNPTAGPNPLPVDPGMSNFVDPSLLGPSRGDTAAVAAGTDPSTVISPLNQPSGAGPLGSIGGGPLGALSGANPGPTPDPLAAGPLGTGAPAGSGLLSGLSGGPGGPGGLLGPLPSAGGPVMGLPNGAAGPLSALGPAQPGAPGGMTGKVRQMMTVPGRGPLAALSHTNAMTGARRNQGNNNNNMMTTLLMSMMMGGGEITPTMMMMLMSASGGGNINAMLPALLMMGQ